MATVAPSPYALWPRNYGAWAVEVSDRQASPHLAVAADSLEAVWDKPKLHTDRAELSLGASYIKLATTRFQEALIARAISGGVHVFDGRVVKVDHVERHGAVTLSDGRTIIASLIVDASGSRTPFIARESDDLPAYQSAYGQLIEVDEHPWAPGEMSLMDFRSLDADLTEPTFLYALPLSDKLVFVEETSLVAHRALAPVVLKRALESRLRQLDIVARRTVDTEVCLIEMGLPLPLRHQRTVAFGAAASFTHPATGYQLMRALRLADPVADALVEGLAQSPTVAAQRAYDVMWPNDDVSAWSLFRFGMNVLASMDRQQLARFMVNFSSLKRDAWQRYMIGLASPMEIVRAMLRVFEGGNTAMRRQLIASARHDMKTLLRAAWQGVAR